MLIVLGWLVLVFFAGYCWVVTIGGGLCELGFSGKISGWVLIPLMCAIFLSHLVVETFPFELAVKVTQ